MQKHILITGANKGVGLATVERILTDQPDATVFLGSRSLDRGMQAREGLLNGHAGWGDRVQVVEIDVSQDASVKSAAARVADHLAGARLHGIVNNAGIGFTQSGLDPVLQVNIWGPRRVCDAFLPMIEPNGGRIVNVASASGPNFVAECSAERQGWFTNPRVTWSQIEELIQECLQIEANSGDFNKAGLSDGAAYGLSKALVNCYTMALARENPSLVVNACTPGFIETDLTRPFAAGNNVTPAQMGMKPPEAGTRANMFLLFGKVPGSGWYFGSDAQRSPLDRYRSPGDPPYAG